jgi:hypothetical protein
LRALRRCNVKFCFLVWYFFKKYLQNHVMDGDWCSEKTNRSDDEKRLFPADYKVLRSRYISTMPFGVMLDSRLSIRPSL